MIRQLEPTLQPCEIEALLRLAGQAQATARRREAASRCAATTKGNNEHLNVEKRRAGLQRCETFDAKRPRQLEPTARSKLFKGWRARRKQRPGAEGGPQGGPPPKAALCRRPLRRRRPRRTSFFVLFPLLYCMGSKWSAGFHRDAPYVYHYFSNIFVCC